MNELKQSVEVICGGCNSAIVVDDESFFGQDAICPECENEIYIPLPEPDELETFIQAKQESVQSSITKRCPYCQETIQEAAIKCKHCGEMLNGEKKKEGIDTDAIGVIGLMIPAVASVFAYYWISQMRLIDNPSETLMLIAVGTIGLTSILFAVEASLLGMGGENDKTKSGKRHSGPVSWFLFCLLLWIIGFPAYLYWRSRYGLKNFVIVGILIALMFVVTMSFLNSAIESHKATVRVKIEKLREAFSTDY